MAILNLYNCLDTYLVIGALLFGFGIYGLVARKTVIGMLIASELVLAGSSVNFMAFNRFLAPDPAVGQIFTLFIPIEDVIKYFIDDDDVTLVIFKKLFYFVPGKAAEATSGLDYQGGHIPFHYIL